jgi:uncharacterized protein
MQLYIQHIPGKGRGVMCDTDLHPGDEVEVCPVIICPPEDREHIDKTHLYNYYFLWDEDHRRTAFAMGYGSIYNHSYEPNCRYETYFEEELIRFVAIKAIPAHTEITVNYNHDPNDQSRVWFDLG